jgi:hypothetical protein
MFLTSRLSLSSPRLSSALLLTLSLITALCGLQTARAQTRISGYVSDRKVYAEPALAEPAAGASYADPVFGTRVLRATGEAECPAPGCGTWYSQWPTFNADATMLLIRRGESGDVLFKRFDPVNFAVGGVVRETPRLQGTTPNWQAATWSRTDPDLIYVVGDYYNRDYPASGMKLYTYRVSSGEFTLVKDFAPELSPGNPDYFFEMHVDARDDLFVLSQMRVGAAGGLPIAFVVWRKSTGRVLLHAQRDAWLDSRKGSPDKTGRWVVFPTNDQNAQADRATARIWDSQTDTWSAVKWTAADDAPSHGDVGSGVMVGHGNFSGGENIRILGGSLAPTVIFDFKDERGVTDWSFDSHATLNPDDESGLTLGLFYDPNIGLPSTGAFRDEIVQVATDGSQQIRRLLHHRSKVDGRTASTGYWAMPKPTISRDGRFVAYTSNWGGSGRYDLFIARIEPAPASGKDPARPAAVTRPRRATRGARQR